MIKRYDKHSELKLIYSSKLKRSKLIFFSQSKYVKAKKNNSRNRHYESYYLNKEITFHEILKRATSIGTAHWSSDFQGYPEAVQVIPDFLRKNLKNHLSKYKLPTLSERVVLNIFKNVPSRLCKSWPDLCNSLVEEIRENYSMISSIIVVEMTLSNVDDVIYDQHDISEEYVSPTKYVGVDVKFTLSGEDILYYSPFIRQLISEAQNMLPDLFINCSKYRFKGFYLPEIFLGIMEKEIDREDLRMEYDWFGKLFLRVSEKNFFSDWKDSKISKFINLIIQITKTIATICIKSRTVLLIRYQVSIIVFFSFMVMIFSALDRIYDTLKSLVHFFTDPKTTPKIAVKVYYSFDGIVVILPTAADICTSYCKLIKRVYEMGKNFVHFEMFHLKTGRRGNISIEKYDDVRGKYEKKICKFVTKIYQQIRDYYLDISGRFREILEDSHTSSERLSSMNMEELIAMADRYIAIKGSINELELNTYFTHFKANNKPLVKTLLFITECRTNQIMNEVLKFHIDYCARNCVEFYKISLQAVKVPENTEELMNLSKFMKFVSVEHMESTRKHIVVYLLLFYRVMEIITVSQTYLEIMGLVLSWVHYMATVINDNAVLLEATKFEFEERLNKVTEKLNEDLENFSCDELDGLDYLDDYAMIGVYTLHVMKCLRKVQQFDETAKWINKEETLFEITLSTYPELDEIKAFVNPFAKLIFQLYLWNIVYQKIMYGSLEKLTIKSVEETLETNNLLINQLQKWFKYKIRQQTNENNPRRFKGFVDDSEYENWPAPLKLLHGAQQQLKQIKEYRTYISILCNPRMTEKHWVEISKITGRDMTPYKGSSLHQFINFKVDDKIDQLVVISDCAIKEYHLKENLIEMKMGWRNIHFLLDDSKKTSQVILGSVDHIQSLIDEHLVKTLSLRSSAYVKPIEDELKAWYEQLSIINITLEKWCYLQSRWLYFFSIFSKGDIVDCMPSEGSMFCDVNSKYKALLKSVEDNSSVLSVANDITVLPNLEYCLVKIEDIRIGVKKYLDKKRLFFSRFFFLSDADMLMLLSETKEPKNVNSYLEKCFSGISKLEFDNLCNINAIYNSEEEKIELVSKVCTSPAGLSVEKWFVQVEDQMVISVRNAITHCIGDHKLMERKQWLNSRPGQIIICVSEYIWTQHIHSCLYSEDKIRMEDYYEAIMDQIQEGVRLFCDITTFHRRKTLSSFIILCIHYKDILYNIWQKDLGSDSNFLWISQLRYYWDDDIKVKVLNSTVKYGYEYYGSPNRLVITPLTERCYNCLMNAFQLQYCGAPQGPAATGKSATIKDLGQALAMQCRLFNCSPALTISDMAKWLKGVASSGCWACFHEFDRIRLSVLSVIGEQILCIMQAKRNNLAVFTFAESMLTLNPSCFICITINPSSDGRVPLPSNLKVVFRPIAMIVPDFKFIVQIILYSHGFENSIVLSTKVVAVYKLCAKQLSPQIHYDYGMRSIKAVLDLASSLKFKYPTKSEDRILTTSISTNILPMLVFEDIPMFKDIVKDVFLNQEIMSLYREDDNLLKNILQVLHDRNLQSVESFNGKILETYEIMKRSNSIMLIGETLGGKSTIVQVLSDALNLKDANVDPQFNTKIQIINPKSVTNEQLFGYYHPQTSEWMDGIIGNTFRNYSNENISKRKWIIFDGPITEDWAENLCTALDENKLLFLNSGEVIKITDSMAIIFECMDLIQASPAIVSRCGIVYVDPNSLGWLPIVKSWNKNIPQRWIKDDPEQFIKLLEWLLPPCLEYMKNQGHRVISMGDLNAVRSVCQLMEIMLLEALEGQDLKYIHTWSQAVVMLSVLWGIAGIADNSSRELFDLFYKSLWQGDSIEGNSKSYPEEIDISLPNEGFLEDYMYSFKGKGTWKYWPEILKVMKPDDIFNARNNMVTTVESLKYTFIMDLFIKHKKSFLLIGPTGTGKSLFIQNLLSQLSAADFVAAFLTLSVSTTACFAQVYPLIDTEQILSKLVKRKKSVYGPTIGKRCIMFIDDLHIPESKDGIKSALELLRQFLDHGYWYSLSCQEKLHIQDLFIIGAMGLRIHCGQPLSTRFLTHFAVFGINISHESLIKILTTTLFLGLRKNGFAADIMGTVQQIIAASMYLYNSVISFLLPTPMKCHYLFNIRDLIRIFQGCSLIRKESVDGKRTFVRLWVHEIFRVFGDKLVDLADKDWLVSKLKFAIEEYYKEPFEVMMEGLYEKEQEQVSHSSLSSLIFTTALDAENNEYRKYEEVQSLEQFYNLAFKTLEEYNSKNKKQINILLFRFALEHLGRICRIISVPYGNGLLVGVNGSGRQSLVKLATQMIHQDIFQPVSTKGCCPVKWHDTLKDVLKEAGARNRHCTFLLHESEIKIDCILQDIDSVLNLGQVPMLYTANEIQDILESVRFEAQEENKNVDVSTLEVFSFYINRCKKNLHVLLCISPLGSELRNRIRMYPALVNSCTIDWFETSWIWEVNGRKLVTTGWPEHALECVAREYLIDVDLEETIKEAIVTISKYFHVSARNSSDKFNMLAKRRTYITSTSFIDFLKHYHLLVKEKKSELTVAKEKYLGGLEKLEFAADQVGIMQKDLESLQPALKKAAEETSEMLKVIETETFEIEKASERVRSDEEIANKQAMGAMGLKTECENDLALAIPILEDAVAALNTLKPADITLVKSMKNPPETVKLVLAAVCVMKGIKPDRLPDPKNPGRKMNDYWGPSKRLLGDMSFLQQLKDYDKDNIPPSIMKSVRSQHLNHKDFKPKVVAKASSAAEGLCKWVIALDKYDVVVKEVAPKKEKLKIAEKEYSETMAILEEKRNLLKGLEDKLSELKENLREANERKIRLQNEVVLCTNKLQKAQRIIGSLGGEKERWLFVSDALQKQYYSIPGDMIISSGIIIYLAPFTPTFRKEITEDWILFCSSLKIPTSADYSLVKALGSKVLIESWNINGLPSDSFSVDNAIILHSSQKWPLLIDPQNQANTWLKRMEKENDLIVTRFSDDYINIVIKCIEMGKPLLLENISEQIDHSIFSILEGNKIQQENTGLIKLHDTVGKCSPRFRFYITTKLKNPHYPPEIYKKLVVINFAITKECLSGKLLGIVTSKESSEIQEKRQNLIEESAKNKQELYLVEDSILKTLSSVRGNILEDENAVNILDSSKAVAENLKKQADVAKKTRDNIENIWLRYKPIADHVAALYYTITNLATLDPMYQYSLNWFIKIFLQSINKVAKCCSIEERIKNLKDTFNYNLYINVTYTLFDKDIILYSFLLCKELLLLENKLCSHEFDLFLGKRNAAIHKKCASMPEKKIPLSQKIWEDICYLDRLPSFNGIIENINKNLELWTKYCTRYNPTCEELPSPWNKTLSHFQKLILLHTLRPDQLTSGMIYFIKEELGEQFLHPPQFDLNKVYKESNIYTPLIFILAPECDSMEKFLSFTRNENKCDKLKIVALGENQENIAETAIKEKFVDGGWICLQNCHLAISWLPTLERIIDEIDPEMTLPEFRLWMTTISSVNFPASILESGIKIIMEGPSGLKKNLLERYYSVPVCDLKYYESCPGQEKIFTRLLYGITLFHSILRERSKFGPLGWNNPYDFNEFDYVTTISQLQMFLSGTEEIPLAIMTYLIEECNYGGKIQDKWDKKIMRVLLRRFINKEVIFSKEYSFYMKDHSYCLPVRNDYKNFIRCIKNLPSITIPEVYGLNKNAEMMSNLDISNKLIDGLVRIFENNLDNEWMSSESYIINISEDVLLKMPGTLDISKFPNKVEDIMNTVLYQEISAFNHLQEVIKATLTNLLKAVQGHAIITPDLEDIFKSLLSSLVPKIWQKISYSSLKPLGSYITDLILRVKYFQNWCNFGKPKDFWVSGFYFPCSFISAIKQDFARKRKISVIEVSLNYEVLRIGRADYYPEEGVFIYGIHLSGARWDEVKHCLEEELPMEMNVQLPLLWVKPCFRYEINMDDKYLCPLYRTAERKGLITNTGLSTNYIITVLLNTTIEPSHWVTRGVALICQLDL